MLNTYEGLIQIWNDKPRLLPKSNEQTVKPMILAVLHAGPKLMDDIIKSLPDVKPNYIRTTVYSMFGGQNGYKKVLGRTVEGLFFLSEKRKLTKIRIIAEFAKGPRKSADVCDVITDIKRNTVISIINKMVIGSKSGYKPTLEKLGDGYYGLILKKFRHG